MPTDLLLPAFFLTLLANAVLVAVAIRALRAHGDRDDDGRLPVRVRPQAPSVRRTVERPSLDQERIADEEPAPTPVGPAHRPPASADEFLPTAAAPAEARPTEPPRGNKPPRQPSSRQRPTSRARSGKPGPPEPSSVDPSAARPAADERPADPPPTSPAKPRPKRDPAKASADARTPRGGARGSRRRFSLPPLDDDHDRVIRSIETFFSGGEAAESADADADSTSQATTVAVVAIHGLAPISTRQERVAFDAAVAAVARTLRGAARTDDRVTSTGRGRFRIVLPATGELAARAYLRRVRAGVEPALAGGDIPFELVTATATVLNESAGVAIAQAEARLEAAVATSSNRRPGRRPKAAAD
jgi:GGDEF domain-containing protein